MRRFLQIQEDSSLFWGIMEGSFWIWRILPLFRGVMEEFSWIWRHLGKCEDSFNLRDSSIILRNNGRILLNLEESSFFRRIMEDWFSIDFPLLVFSTENEDSSKFARILQLFPGTIIIPHKIHYSSTIFLQNK